MLGALKNSGIELEVIDVGIITHVVPGFQGNDVRSAGAPFSHCACAKLKKKGIAKGRFEPRPLPLRVNVLPTVLTELRCWSMVEHSSCDRGIFRDSWWSIYSKLNAERRISCTPGTNFRQIGNTQTRDYKRTDPSGLASGAPAKD